MLLTRTLIVVFVALDGVVFSHLLPHQTHDQTNNSTDPPTATSLHPFNYTDAELSTQTSRNLVLGSDFKELRVPQKKLENVRSRNKRSLVNLRNMIVCGTSFSAMDLLTHGNHCGWGGSGEPIDLIDRCCQRHDSCYDGLLYTYSRWTVYLSSYDWYCNDRNPYCAWYQDYSQRAVCDCDLEFIRCVRVAKYGFDYYGETNDFDDV